jgi:hypothetical protein
MRYSASFAKLYKKINLFVERISTLKGRNPLLDAAALSLIAWLLCFLLLIGDAKRRASFEPLEDWIPATICFAIPVLTGFSVLYRSGWRREINTPARICLSFLASCLIWTGTSVVGADLLFFLWFLLQAFCGGHNP